MAPKRRTWPADRTQRWPLSRIKPYPRNARTHSEEQVELIARSMEKFGVTAPLLVDEKGVLIYGHGRLRAAQKLRLKEMPVSIAKGWTEEEKNAYRIADNQIGLRSGWDQAMLSEELRELKLEQFDLGVLGFEQPMLEWMTGGDLVADPQAEWSGMPAFSNPSAKSFRHIVVHFSDQAGVDAFAQLVGQVITAKTQYLWFPKIQNLPLQDWRGEQETGVEHDETTAA